MNTLDRRHLLTTAAGAGAAMLAGRWLPSPASAADKVRVNMAVGQELRVTLSAHLGNEARLR